MKTMFVALMTVASAFNCAAAQGAELKFFENYNPQTKAYTRTFSATPEKPVSAEALMNTTTAACYKGDVEEVETLIWNMIQETNAQSSDAQRIDEVILGHMVDKKPFVIKLFFKVHGGPEVIEISWNRIGPCSK